MTLYKQIKPIWIIKNIVLCLGLTSLVACGLDSYSTFHSNRKNFEDFNQELHLTNGSQLFSLKAAGDNKSSKAALSDKTGASGDDSSADEDGGEGLVIVDTKGKGKRFLSEIKKFERLHLVKDGQKNAYIACMEFKHAFDFDLKNPWLIIKDGKKVIPIKSRKADVYGNCGDFVGQTETDGHLLFRNGDLVDLQGNQLKWENYSKNLKNVTGVDYVSGDIVAVSRDVGGNRVSSIANLITKKRKSYGTFWTPNFVEIAGGKGLISDTAKSSTISQSNITKLEEEIDETSTNRATTLAPADLDGCRWFMSSTRIATSNAAILACYVDPKPGVTNSYSLKWVEFDATNKLKAEEIATLSNDDQGSLYSYGRSNFTNGDGFTVMRLANEVLIISHATKINPKRITPKLQSVFDIRISEDKKSFSVFGEDNDGELYLETYDANGTAGQRVAITVE